MSKTKKTRIRIAQPWITEHEIQYVNDAVKNGWGNHSSDYIKKLEKEFSSLHKTEYAVATSSCTGATHMALKAMGIGSGDEVILPEITWASCPSAVIYTGAKPVFVDVKENTWCIDPKKILEAITPKTKAIMPVHVYGNVCEMDEIMKIADRFDLKVIEDAAEALGSEYKDQKVGSIGDCGVFSFHGTKMATSGEGGIFITNNKKLFDDFNILHDQGRIPEEEKFFYPHKLGYKYKISNLQAAIACAQIERLEELVNKKNQIFYWYKNLLQDINFIDMNHQQEYVKNSYWMPTIVFDKSVNINRDDLMKYLDKKGIDSRPFFYPLSSLPMFKKVKKNNISYSLSNRGIYLPSAFYLSKKDINYIVEAIKEYLFDKPVRV
tara:strand:- start:299 stop:1435 length:1137 start_codon:yes stop_codon:yes gene_type:complete